LSRWLGREMGLDLGWFDEIVDLFGPATPDAYWAMWHAVDLGEELLVKLYLNPRLGGRAPNAVVHEVLARLGAPSASTAVSAVMAGGAAPSHLSFDLGLDGKAPRLKVYMRHEGTDLRSLTRTIGLVSGTAADDFARVCAAISDDVAILRRRSPFTTLYFTDLGADRPARVALHLPVQTYVPEDAEASHRVRTLFDSFELDPSGYQRAYTLLSAERRISEGLHSYVGFQRDDAGPRVTTYFGARVYAARRGWAARAPVRTWPAPHLSAEA
jgi:hypothetical protein